MSTFLPDIKRCPKCKKELPKKDFNLNGARLDGLDGYCKKCKLNRSIDERRMLMLEHKYGITIAEYEILLKSQNGVCAICNQSETSKHQSGKIKSLAVDHCHKTGKIRGLLCDKCNRALGYFKDDPDITERATKYLRQ